MEALQPRPRGHELLTQHHRLRQRLPRRLHSQTASLPTRHGPSTSTSSPAPVQALYSHLASSLHGIKATLGWHRLASFAGPRNSSTNSTSTSSSTSSGSSTTSKDSATATQTTNGYTSGGVSQEEKDTQRFERGSPLMSRAADDALDNSSLTSVDWPDWIASSSGSDTPENDNGSGDVATSSRDHPSSGGDGATLSSDGGGSGGGADGLTSGSNGCGNGTVAAGSVTAAETSVEGNAAAAAAGALSGRQLAASIPTTTVRVAVYAIAASFDRRQLEAGLRAAYGATAVRKYPDVVHCQLSRGGQGQSGSDAFFFDNGVVACWGLVPETERELVRGLGLACAVQVLPGRDQETDVFRCTYTTNPLVSGGVAAPDSSPIANFNPAPAPVLAPVPAPPAVASVADLDAFPGPIPVISATTIPSVAAAAASGEGMSTGGTSSSRRFARRAAASSSAAAVVTSFDPPPPLPPPPPPVLAPPAVTAPVAVAPPSPPWEAPSALGPFSLLSFPPQVVDDTVILHLRLCGDVATQLAVSYALAQSTKLSAFEKAVGAIVEETRSLPEALAEHGEVKLSEIEIGKLMGKVFVLKRSVNLLNSVLDTPDFFWYAPDQLQALYSRITTYVELSARVELLNGRFAVLQELLELLRAQEENRHGTRLELVVIWLIVVEVVLGFFELMDLFGVIGPPHSLIH